MVGNPRLHPRTLLAYLEEEARLIRSGYGEFVLICSSFDPKAASSYAFPQEAALDARYREHFYAMIQRLAPRVKLVYRPHPSDGDQFAARVAALVPVERRFTILPWIAASRLVVNAKCTSSFEAVRLGVPSVTLSLKSGAHAKLSTLSRRFYDVDSICRYIEAGEYAWQLPDYKMRYVELISGPDKPERRLLDRLDAIEIPETRRFDLLKWAATLTGRINGVWYGRGPSQYVRAKYGPVSYADRFPGFSFHLGGQLVVSND